jgi:WD40 repeat protein
VAITEDQATFEFDLFLSYSTAPDYRLAAHIESYLETFHKLRGPHDLNLRPLQVCRDGSDFKLSQRADQSSLTVENVLEQYLSRSRWLLVLCSKQAATSAFVSFEIDWFIRHRGIDAVLVGLTEGADPATAPKLAFPAALLEHGLHQRPFYDFRDHRRRPVKRWAKVRALDEQLALLAAHLHSDSAGRIMPIWQREAVRSARRRMIAFAAAACVFSGIALAALLGWRKASINAVEARHKEQESKRLLALDYQERGRALLLEGLPQSALGFLIAARDVLGEHPVWQMLAAASGGPPTLKLQADAPVNAAEFSPDGRCIVTGSDRGARVWDARTGKPLTPPMAHRGRVKTSVFSPDGQRIVTASEDHTARVWDAKTGEALTPPLAHKDTVNMAAFSRDGELVVTASDDGTAAVWNSHTGVRIGSPLTHARPVLSAAFSPDGQRVVTGSWDYTARVWNSTLGTPITPPILHWRAVRTVMFSPDGNRIVTAGYCIARIWDAQTGEPSTPPLRHRDEIRTAAFSRDGKYLVTASDDTTARVWDTTTGTAVTPELKHKRPVVAASFSSDGSRVITGSADRTARVWNARTGEPIGVPLEQADAITAAQFAPRTDRVLTASNDGSACVWQTPASPIRSLAHAGQVEYAEFSRDGARVATASSDNTARVWDARSGEPLTPPLKHDEQVYSAVFSRDGQRVVTASWDGSARIWDARTGELSIAIKMWSSPRYAMFTSDDHYIVATDDRGVQVWDARTGDTASKRHEFDDVLAMSFSPDGGRVAISTWKNTARVWNVSTGEAVTPPLAHAGQITSVTFSEDGTTVLTAGMDKTARIWDARSGKLLTTLQLARGLTSAAFSSDARRVLTVSNDFTVRTWDVGTRRELSPPFEHGGRIVSAAFCSDGTRVVTASHDHTMRIWDAITGNPLIAPIADSESPFAALFSPQCEFAVMRGGWKAYVLALPRERPTAAEQQRLSRCSIFTLQDGTLSRNDAACGP